MRDLAALFVEAGGVYFGVSGVDPWCKSRDARKYRGSSRVVAHPPCERWGRFWPGRPGERRIFGDDDGCFESALASVRRCGGVLEHPRDSGAWRVFGLNRPPSGGGWVNADLAGGWTCCVEQGHYGHVAPKATWLLWFGRGCPPSLVWGASGAVGRVTHIHSAHRSRTPVAFPDLLLDLAECG